MIQTTAQTRAQTAYSTTSPTQQNAEAALKSLATLTPDDVNVQYELGQAASAAGDYASAVAAYERFLKLSPNDVDAAQVRQLLKAAKASAAASASTSTSG